MVACLGHEFVTALLTGIDVRSSDYDLNSVRWSVRSGLVVDEFGKLTLLLIIEGTEIFLYVPVIVF